MNVISYPCFNRRQFANIMQAHDLTYGHIITKYITVNAHPDINKL